MQPSLAFCFSLQPMTAHWTVRRRCGRSAVIGCNLKQNANEGCNSYCMFYCTFYFTCDLSLSRQKTVAMGHTSCCSHLIRRLPNYLSSFYEKHYHHRFICLLQLICRCRKKRLSASYKRRRSSQRYRILVAVAMASRITRHILGGS